jgi:hypothetical protein
MLALPPDSGLSGTRQGNSMRLARSLQSCIAGAAVVLALVATPALAQRGPDGPPPPGAMERGMRHSMPGDWQPFPPGAGPGSSPVAGMDERRDMWIAECTRRMSGPGYGDRGEGHQQRGKHSRRRDHDVSYDYREDNRERARYECATYLDAWFAAYARPQMASGYGAPGSCCQPVAPVVMQRGQPQCTETVETYYETVRVPGRRVVPPRPRPRAVPDKRIRIAPDKRVRTN